MDEEIEKNSVIFWLLQLSITAFVKFVYKIH